VYWDSYELRFHHPAEHQLNNTQYAMEMQIFSNDPYKNKLLCTAGIAAISILFELDDASNNPWFDWQANATAGLPVTVDLNSILSKVGGTTNSVSGYSGSDTMPDCGKVCWYIVNQPQQINSTQLNFFMYSGVPYTIKNPNQYNANTILMYNNGIFATPNIQP